MVFPGRYQTLKNENLEILEHVRMFTSHHFHKLRREFKRRLFKSQVFRRCRQDKTKIYMNQMTIALQQNVAIMSVKQ